MKPLSDAFFGSDGLQCVFTIDDAGNTAIGYVIKQTGSKTYIVTNGTVTKVCTLAQNSSDVSDLSSMPPGTCTFLLSINSVTEHVKYLDSTKCATIESGLRTWRDDNNPGTIIIPVLTPPLPPNQPVFSSMSIVPELDGSVNAIPSCISEDGSVIGGSLRNFGTSLFQAVYWDTENNLHTLPGTDGNDASCSGVSGDGTIFCGSFNAAAVYWDDGGLHYLPTLDGATNSSATAISVDGTHPVYWKGGEIFDLGYQGSQFSSAYAVSRDGSVIAGAHAINYFTSHPLVWRNGIVSDLDLYPGGISAQPTGVSYNGNVIVGWAYAPGFIQHAVYWDRDGLHDLPFLPGAIGAFATSVSADGTLIGGCAFDSSGNQLPVYWLDGVVTEVNGIPGGQPGYIGAMNAVSADMSTAAGDGWDASFNDLPLIWRGGS